MTDRERILKGLECHAVTKYISTHETCPYKDIDICHYVLAEEAYKYISEQPQIVRCKDCRYNDQDLWHQNYYKGRMAWCAKEERLRENDWFCADGKLK